MADGNLARGSILADTPPMTTNLTTPPVTLADPDSNRQTLASSYVRSHAGQSPIDWYTDLADWYLTAEDDTERARR